MREHPWTLAYDDNYKASYWFNTETGESEWVVDESANHDESVNDESFNSFMSDETMESASLIDTPSHPSHHNLHNKLNIKEVLRRFDGDNQPDHDMNEEMKIGMIVDLLAKADDDDNEATSYTDVMCFYICTIIHVLIVENALLIVESFIRSMMFVILGLVCLTCRSIVPSSTSIFYYSSYEYFREGIICGVAMISFMIPFLVIMIYREICCCHMDFNICSLPTLLGWVDSRRFAVICFGSGSHANNIIFSSDGMHRSLDTWPGDIIFSPHDIKTILARRDVLHDQPT